MNGRETPDEVRRRLEGDWARMRRAIEGLFGAIPGAFDPIAGGVPNSDEPPPEDTIASQMLKGLVTGSINDITYEQMNRIVRALQRMSRGERDAPKLVAAVLTEELGPQKALGYLDKSLAAGLIKKRDYEAMRAALILPLPREEIPRPAVAKAAAELVETQTRMRGEVRRLRRTGSQALERPFRALDEDVKRLRRAWGR